MAFLAVQVRWGLYEREAVWIEGSDGVGALELKESKVMLGV